ncbi:MAG: sn-glycerol-3-phosphate ABC transporter ATP-binding protein UgpC [Gammaproteobacteria bacterium]|nr:MAG: sn-glycerol-3-phosphate ABC transporter ATP-binding protein UgpC [Gammaproteobacteria bacterium]
MSRVQYKNIRKSFGDTEVVRDFSMTIEDGEFMVLLGESGCGKSTLLRILAGLETQTSGDIYIGERCVNGLDAKDRNLAMVFQSYALYPHMTVYENIAFALKMKKLPRTEIDEKVQWAAKMLKLDTLLDRKPKALSGGQRQRVAMGRAMVRTPEVFLFDEPLSNLDAKLRTEMRHEIKSLHRKLGTTTIYVTHDQVEAMTLADRIVIMNKGVISQVGTPEEVFHHPANLFVAQFIGSPAMNIFDGVLTRQAGNQWVIESGGSTLPLPPRFHAQATETLAVKVGIRPSDIHVLEGASHAEHLHPVDFKVEDQELLGAAINLTLHTGDVTLLAEAPGDMKFAPGTAQRAWLNLDALHVFDARTGETLSGRNTAAAA